MVHRNVLSAASAAIAILVSAPGAAQQAAPEGARAQLEERQAEFLAALAASDAEAAAGFYAEDAVVHVADMPAIEGRNAIRAFYGRVFDFLAATRATPEATRVSATADMAYSTGRTVNAFRGPDGPVEYAGKYLLVWRRMGDEWLIVAYAISSDGTPQGHSGGEPRSGGPEEEA